MSCNMFSVWLLTDVRRHSGHITKPGSTYSHSGNLAETTLAETETSLNVILEAVSVP